jgi:hypothetical protein
VCVCGWSSNADSCGVLEFGVVRDEEEGWPTEGRSLSERRESVYGRSIGIVVYSVRLERLQYGCSSRKASSMLRVRAG